MPVRAQKAACWVPSLEEVSQRSLYRPSSLCREEEVLCWEISWAEMRRRIPATACLGPLFLFWVTIHRVSPLKSRPGRRNHPPGKRPCLLGKRHPRPAGKPAPQETNRLPQTEGRRQLARRLLQQRRNRPLPVENPLRQRRKRHPEVKRHLLQERLPIRSLGKREEKRHCVREMKDAEPFFAEIGYVSTEQSAHCRLRKRLWMDSLYGILITNK